MPRAGGALHRFERGSFECASRGEPRDVRVMSGRLSDMDKWNKDAMRARKEKGPAGGTAGERGDPGRGLIPHRSLVACLPHQSISRALILSFSLHSEHPRSPSVSRDEVKHLVGYSRLKLPRYWISLFPANGKPVRTRVLACHVNGRSEDARREKYRGKTGSRTPLNSSSLPIVSIGEDRKSFPRVSF